MWLFLLLLVGLACAFRRDAVESPPAVLSRTYDIKPFGVEHIDLRDSVEKVPTQRERMQESLPLRSAVEKRPTPYFRGPWWKIVPGTKQSDQSGRRLFCFVESWSSYRRAPVGFTAGDIDPYACTHVIYAFASVDPLTSKLLPLDEEYDVVKGGYRSIVGLKRVNSNLKVMISVAGRLSKMTSSASSRRNFILSTVKFMAENGFDGLDLHWEYPGAEELGGMRSDKDNLSLLVEELSGVMESRGWLLTASFPPSRFRLDDGYDIPRIAPYLHFVLLKSFDYHQEREGSANHPSPLVMSSQEDPLSVYYNVDYSVRYYLKRGVRRNQLILGIPFFGRSYTLKEMDKWMPGSPVKAPGKEARFTQQPGFMSYYEVCNQLRKKGWVQHRDSNTGSAFMVRGDQWVGFEDPYSIRLKMTYMQRERLGGAMVWALDLDDFKGLCGPKYPLLNTVRVALTPEIPAMLSPGVGVTVLATQDNCTGEGYAGEAGDCSVYYRCQWAQKHTYICPHGLYYDPQLNLCNWPTLVTCQKNLLSAASSIILAKKGSASGQRLKEEGPKVVCYFTNWAWYRKGEGKFIPEHIEPSLCTHIIYAFASLEPNTLGILPFDSWADIDNGMYKRVAQLKERGPAVMLAVGGWTDSIGDKYSKMVSSGSSRRSFINSVVAFLRRYEFSGLSLEWNHPVCWQSDCSKGPASDVQNYAKLAQEMREAFDKEDPPLLLSVSLSGYPEVIKKSYDLSSLSKSVDFFTVMSYDYHGAWEGVTGHVAPIKGHPPSKFSYYNIGKSLELLTSGGVDKSKLVLGIPMYGQSYTLANKKETGINSKTKGPGDAGKWTAQPGMLAYYEICYKIRKSSWRKETTEYGPYAYLGDQWVSFDDEKAIADKGNFVKSNGLGGLMAWTIDLDDFQNLCCDGQFPLLSAINKVLGREVKGNLASGCTRPKPPVTPAPPTTTLDPEAGITTTEHQHTHWTEGTTKPTSSTPWWTPETTKTTTSRPTTTTRRTTTTTRRTTTTKKPTTTSTASTTSQEPESTTTKKPSTSTVWWVPESTTTKPSTSTVWWVPDSTTTKPSTPWWVPETTTTTKRPTTTRTTTKPSTSTTTEKESEQTGEQNTEPPSSCQTGDYKPVNGNCQEYYRCILGEFRKERCAGDLHWNELRTICDWPSEAKCTSEINIKPSTEDWMSTKPTTQDWWPTSKKPTTRQTTTERTTTTRKPTTTKEPFEMVCQNGQYYPVSGNCAAFYMCVNGILIEQPCAPGLHWNMDTQICDWSFSSKCSPDTAVLVKAEQGCNRGIFAPHHKNCNKYLQCQWDKYEVHTCAPGLHWNQKKMICDWPKSADCERSGGGDSDTDVVVATEAPSVTVSSTYKPSTTTEWTWKPEEQTEWSWTSTTTEEPWPETPYQHPLSGYYKVVCYFTNWAWYRQGSGKYLPEDIDYDLCTHIIYGFAVLDYSELIIKSHDSWADFDNNFYNRVVWFRRKGVKVLLALGGWNDSQGDKYSRLVNNPSARSKFIAHAVPFLLKYKFDGLDLDWEYPKCWQTNCNQGKDSDKEAFAMWVKELKTEFNKHGLLLSAAVSPSKTIIDVGYDLPVLAQYLDWISVMTYDYHGQWDKKTGHVAPMYEHPDDDFYYFNANYTIHYWINGGVPSRKLVMGMPMYGQGFTLSNEKDHGLNAPAPRPAEAGEYTRAAGFLAYYEICDRIKNRGWKVVKDEQNRIGPYAYHGSQWVGFDDQEMIKLKSEYIRDMDLGGGMIWALDLDDFKNTCGQGKHPLLNTIAKTLASPPNGTPTRPTTSTRRPTTSKQTKPTKPTYKPGKPGKPGKPPTTTKKPTRPTEETTPHHTSTHKPSHKPTEPEETTPALPGPEGQFKVVCYFTNWAWYRQGTGKYLPSDIDPNLCTHIVYGFAVLDTDRLVIKPHDSWADLDNKFYEKVTALKAKGIKVTLAIGGWNDSAGNKYSRLVNSRDARQRFNEHVLKFILEYNFDGLDLDWEYPKCWQVDCNKGPDSDKQAFADWVTELRELFTPHGLLLSAAVSPAKTVIDNGYDVKVLSDKLDWIAVMCYDYHGQWDKRTGHVAPMYIHDEDFDATFNANFTMHYWLSQGADRKKLVMGMPMYGQSFSLAENTENGLNAPTYGGGEAGDETRARGFLSYYEICDRVQRRGWEVVKDTTGAMGPYARSRDQWVSFDDAAMIKHKSEYVKRHNFGGAMIWALDLDDFRNTCGCEEYPLLRTINRVLRGYPEGPLCSLSKLKTTNALEPPGFKVDPPCPQITGDKKDCTKFYTCQYGILIQQDCPPGLHFSQKTLMCDWPENAKCGSNETPDENNENEQGEMVLPPSLQEITSTTTAVSIIEKPADTGEFKVVCYFTNWAWYRQGKGKYLPEDIDTSLCTHVIYAFAVLDSERLEIKPHDPWADIDNSFFTKVSSLVEKGIKVLLGLGGWNDSLGDKYSRLVNSPAARRNFVRQAVEFVDRYNFQGLDLDWEYPKCWQVDCNKGPESDKEGFAALVMELSEEFKRRGWLLSAAVSPSKTVINQAYDVPVLARHLDWIALMAYDYHGHWEGKTGHVAPLYYNEGDEFPHFNGNFSVNYWLDEGVPKKKLVLGMPLYGQSFTLRNESDTDLQAPISGPGMAGQFTRAGGFLAYYEICDTVSGGNWVVKRHETGAIGPIAYKGNQWISYDDVDDIRRKSQYVKEHQLGGAMVWALDLDDFRNICGCGKNPLLTTINQELRSHPGNINNCT